LTEISADLLGTAHALPLVAALAVGLLIGIERGWRQRGEKEGTRIAGVRTFALIGGLGGLGAVVAQVVSALVASIIVAAAATVLVAAFLRAPSGPRRRDTTTIMAAMVTLLLGLLAGAGEAGLAIAGAAFVTLVLATREQTHSIVHALTPEEMRSFGLFAAISAGVLPFLPDRDLGPYSAWNPFDLWLVVVLIIGFSVTGYIANRVFGEKRGTIATAVIGGAYSSTAVTASLSSRLGADDSGPLATGIALASAVMYIRVLLLAAVLTPRTADDLLLVLGPATIVAWVAAAVAWRMEPRSSSAPGTLRPAKPFRFLPAVGFAAAVAGAALLVRWAQADFGQIAGTWSLFIAGSFDVDAAIVTLSSLPVGSIRSDLAALALAGTVAVNMGFKTVVVLANARLRKGFRAIIALLASQAFLVGALAWGLYRFGS
jgi:uncharacterized membrane protein (DUF4010 family)